MADHLDVRRSRRDWVVAALAVVSMFAAGQVLLAFDAPVYAFGVFLVVLWALLMLYYRRVSGQRDNPQPPERDE